MASTDMDELVEYLRLLLVNQFPNDFSQAYYGDVMVYPPRAFQSPSGESRSVLVLLPRYDRLERESRDFHQEMRRLGLYVIIMVNMVPFFSATPEIAFGEKLLVQQVTKVRQFLAQRSNFDVNGTALTSTTGDVNWRWLQRDNSALRAAAVEFEVLVSEVVS